MSASSLALSQVIAVRPRFSRSVHLERDFYEHGSAGYYLTPSARELLQGMALAWDKPAERAITLVGPYGAGKSAFCVFLAQLVEGCETELKQLQAYDKALAKKLGVPEHRLLPVLIVGGRVPMAQALVKGLDVALKRAQTAKIGRELRKLFPTIWDANSPSPREVADLYSAAARLARQNGLGGVLLIADELGKFLEYAALHPKEGDIFILQELAEAAARSQDAPLFVMAVLHQNAEAYAQKLGRAHQAEWTKVGERFREVPFFPSDAERMDMVGFALHHTKDLHLNGHMTSLTASCDPLLPAGFGERFEKMAHAAYPLHPLVLLALPALFRKTGQSHRSLFNFLAGEEAHALGRFIRDNTYSPGAPPLFMLDTLFDYAAEVLLGGWSAGVLARLWAEAVEAVERALQVSPDALRVLKSIALLGLLRDPRLPAQRNVLELALRDSTTSPLEIASRVEAALNELLERRLIALSRVRGSYRLWEGGDVDVESELATARAGLPVGTTLQVATERDLCPPERRIARRHSYRTGTLRFIHMQPCAASALADATKNANGNLSVLLCLAENEEELERVESSVRADESKSLLFGLARETPALREAAREVAACHVVAQNTPALQADRAARRELVARRFEAESAFLAEWKRIFESFSDDPSDARWFYIGEEQRFERPRAFAEFLSHLADRFFEAAPVLRNELINRHALSSAAAAGRRNLIEAMLLHGEKPRLGIEGYPPELSMYECLLRATGLHREHESGVWEFTAPPEDDPAGLRPVWDEMQDAIFGEPENSSQTGSGEPLLVSALWKRLAVAPFGLTQGVMPPLLLAFLLSQPHRITLYREGTFLPSPGIADWEVLLRRPELFALAGCRLNGPSRIVVETLANRWNTPPYLVPVVRALLERAAALPAFAWKTRELPDSILRLRAALERARVPETLLMREIPSALGVEMSNAVGLCDALETALDEWSVAYPDALQAARDELMQACGLPSGDVGLRELQNEAAAWVGGVVDNELTPLVVRAVPVASPAHGGETDPLETILAGVAGRPPRSWSDADRERFHIQAQHLGALWCEERRRQERLDGSAGIAQGEEPVPENQEEDMAALPVLSPSELKHASRLAANIKNSWRNASKPVPPNVAREAILLLWAELEEEATSV